MQTYIRTKTEKIAFLELRRGDRPIQREKTRVEWLTLLAENPGRLVTREQIIHRLCGEDVFVDTRRGISTAVHKLPSACAIPVCPRAPARSDNKRTPILMRRAEPEAEQRWFHVQRDHWADGPDPSMLADAGELDPADETFREHEKVIDPKYLDEIRSQAKQFSTNFTLDEPDFPSALKALQEGEKHDQATHAAKADPGNA